MKTKLNYHKDKDAFEKWASDYCEQRHIATLKYLFEKAGENPLKKRFYLGKNIKEKAESISSNYGNFLSNRIPDKNGNINSELSSLMVQLHIIRFVGELLKNGRNKLREMVLF